MRKHLVSSAVQEAVKEARLSLASFRVLSHELRDGVGVGSSEGLGEWLPGLAMKESKGHRPFYRSTDSVKRSVHKPLDHLQIPPAGLPGTSRTPNASSTHPPRGRFPMHAPKSQLLQIASKHAQKATLIL